MTHTDTQKVITEIMESLDESVEHDQLINKLVDKDIITQDEVVRINMVEEKNKIQELVMVLLEKDQTLHPLVLKILETLTKPSTENTRRTDRAINNAGSGSSAVVKPERRILSNAEVSDDWELKNFLFELSTKISDKELQDMKDLMHGESGFTTKSLEKLERPMSFFRQMMNTGKLNSYNLHFLQALVRRIGRKDLNDDVRHFCMQSNKKPIHFFTPSEQPENGYRYVKHHIGGDIEKLSHAEKEKLRATVAEVLCVPITFVFIKGIEPSSSLLITFMVPEDDVESCIQLYIKEGQDSFHFTINIRIKNDVLWLEEDSQRINETSKPYFEQLEHLLASNQNLQSQLEERDERLVDLQAKVDSKDEETTVDQYDPSEDEDVFGRELPHGAEFFKRLAFRLIETMKTMQPREYKNGFGSLKLSSASAMYGRLLKQAVDRCGVESDLLNRLLDTRVVIENICREQSQKQMLDVIQMLTHKVEELTQINGFVRMSAGITGGSSSILQDILSIQAQNVKHEIEQQRVVQSPLGINEIFGIHVIQRIQPATLEEEDQKLLEKMTLELTPKDQSRLKRMLHFSDLDKEKLKKNPNKLLEQAVLKEYFKGRQDPLEILLYEILAKINRGPLVFQFFPDLAGQVPKIHVRRSTERKPHRDVKRSVTPNTGENEALSH